MSREINAATEAAAGAETVRVAALVLMDFAGAPLYTASTPYNLTWNGNEYVGVGGLGSVSPVQEGNEQQAYSLEFKISGITPELISIALNEDYQGRDVTLRLALLDSDHAIIGDPVLVFSGLMDVMEFENGDKAEIVVTAQSRLAKWEEPSNTRYNNAAQQRKFPGDLGLEYVEQMVEKEIKWPA